MLLWFRNFGVDVDQYWDVARFPVGLCVCFDKKIVCFLSGFSESSWSMGINYWISGSFSQGWGAERVSGRCRKNWSLEMGEGSWSWNALGVVQDNLLVRASVRGILPPFINCINTVLGVAVREEMSKKGVMNNTHCFTGQSNIRELSPKPIEERETDLWGCTWQQTAFSAKSRPLCNFVNLAHVPETHTDK